MNVIFLDIDGVLNCGSYLKEIHNDVKELVKNKSNYNFEEYKTKRLMIKIDVNRLKILREIIEATGSYVVIISSWKSLRDFPLVERELINMGIPIIGSTDGRGSNRGEGIKKYLSENNVTNYIVLDDSIFDDYDSEIISRLIQTSFYKDGLNEKHKEEAIKMLKIK